MRVLFVCTILPQKRADWWRIYNISEILKNYGNDIQFVHYCRESNYNRADLERFHDHIFITFKSILTSTLLIHFKHLKILLKGDYDIVYCNGPCSVFYSLFGKITRVPIIFDMHGDVVEEYSIKNKKLNLISSIKFCFLKIIDYISINCSDLILCVSEKEIKFLNEKKGISLEKMHYITNGVDLEFFKLNKNEKIKQIKNELGLNDKIIFGYIGDFQEWQGINNLVEVAKIIDENDTTFIFVGGNIDIDKENIIIFPWVSREKIIDYYSICDILILPRPSHPSTEVAAPTKFSEYTSMSKPILTTNVGDAAEIVIKNKCGIVIKNNSINNLIDGINQFRGLSKEELNMMASNSRKVAENQFNWDKIGLKLINIINKLGNKV